VTACANVAGRTYCVELQHRERKQTSGDRNVQDIRDETEQKDHGSGRFLGGSGDVAADE
jgi:hypothetical protein